MCLVPLKEIFRNLGASSFSFQTSEILHMVLVSEKRTVEGETFKTFASFYH